MTGDTVQEFCYQKNITADTSAGCPHFFTQIGHEATKCPVPPGKAGKGEAFGKAGKCESFGKCGKNDDIFW